MNNPPKRRWFQVHLSTALLLTFAAGGLMWLNFNIRKSTIDLPKEDQDQGQMGWGRGHWFLEDRFIYREQNGWPYPFNELSIQMSKPRLQLSLYETRSILEPSTRSETSRRFTLEMLAMDIIVSLGLLVALGGVCEWVIRRNTSGREAPPPGPNH